MASGKTPSRMERGGSPTADRLASRSVDRKSLKRKAMPGGGEVFSGDVASRALKSLGARAMTVDRSIIVSEDFDPSKAEDQALFAHEQYHVDHSGGEGTHHGRDAEEVAARTVERMVLHRAMAGGGAESHEASHAAANAADPTSSQDKSKKNETDDAAQRGYDALAAQGLSHGEIVQKLAWEAISAIDVQREQRQGRFGDKKGFF